MSCRLLYDGPSGISGIYAGMNTGTHARAAVAAGTGAHAGAAAAAGTGAYAGAAAACRTAAAVRITVVGTAAAGSRTGAAAGSGTVARAGNAAVIAAAIVIAVVITVVIAITVVVAAAVVVAVAAGTDGTAVTSRFSAAGIITHDIILRVVDTVGHIVNYIGDTAADFIQQGIGLSGTIISGSAAVAGITGISCIA